MLSVLMAAMLMAAAEPSASAAADAPAAAGAPATRAKAAKPKGSDKVCWDERPTGSHISKHFCATRDEREKMEQDAQAAVTSRARAQPPGGLGPSR